MAAGELGQHLPDDRLTLLPMVAPGTDARRLPSVLDGRGGFVYCVSVNGVTGTSAADAAAVRDSVERIRQHSDLPVCVGFGIRTAQQAGAVAAVADGVVVGSALVECLYTQGIEAALRLTRELTAELRPLSPDAAPSAPPRYPA